MINNDLERPEKTLVKIGHFKPKKFENLWFNGTMSVFL